MIIEKMKSWTPCLLALFLMGSGFTSKLSFAQGSYQQTKPNSLIKKVAVIHSYIPGEWYHGLNRGFQETLGKLGVGFEFTPLLYDSEFWLTKPIAEQQKEQARIIGQLKTLSPDLVVICDDEAGDAFVKITFQAGFPIIFTGMGRSPEDIPWLKEIPRSAITGVLETYPVSKFIGVLERLLPSVKTISILSSKKPTSEIICDSVEKEMNSEEFKRTHKIRLRNVNKLRHWEEWKQSVGEMNAKDNAVWVLVPYDVRDTNNLQVPLPQMGRWFRKHLKIPYIGMSVVHTKMGGLMSVQITPYDLGRQAAEMAAKYFSGVGLDRQPIEKTKYHQIEINMTEARRLKVAVPQDLMGAATLVENPALQYGR